MNFPSDISKLFSKLLTNEKQYQEIHSNENLGAGGTHWKLLHEIHNATPSLRTEPAAKKNETPSRT